MGDYERLGVMESSLRLKRILLAEAEPGLLAQMDGTQSTEIRQSSFYQP